MTHGLSCPGIFSMSRCNAPGGLNGGGMKAPVPLASPGGSVEKIVGDKTARRTISHAL